MQNTTGKPSADNYKLGRGEVFISELVNNLPKEWRHVGNVPDFGYTVETETLKHQSSMSGLKTTDKEVTLSQEVRVSFGMEEVDDFNNLALFLHGDIATPVNAAIAGFAEHAMVVGVKKGRWYDIVSAAGVRAYDITAGNLTVEKSGATDVALVLGTDYELDTVMGRIFLLSTAVNIADGDTMDVTLAAEAGAKTLERVRGLKNSGKVVAVKFIAANPANSDKKKEWQFHKVTLKAEGDLALIGDDWQQMKVGGSCESNPTADANSPFFSVTAHADA